MFLVITARYAAVLFEFISSICLIFFAIFINASCRTSSECAHIEHIAISIINYFKFALFSLGIEGINKHRNPAPSAIKTFIADKTVTNIIRFFVSLFKDNFIQEV